VIFLFPHVSHAEIISVSPSTDRPHVDENLWSLVGLSDGMGTGCHSDASDSGSEQRNRQEEPPAQQNQHRSHMATLMAAIDFGGGMSTPPHAESNGGSSGIVASGPAVVLLRVLGHVSVGYVLAPPSPDPLALLDPPKISG